MASTYENIGRSLGTDYFHLADQLNGEEREYWRSTATSSTARSCR